MEDLLDSKTVKMSMKALMTLMESKKKKKDELMEAERVCAVVSLKKMPDLPLGKWKHIVIKMPHCPIAEKPSVCLFVKDLQKKRKFDDESAIVHYKDYLRKRGIDFIDEIIPFHMLRTEFKPYELKRQLANRHDKFLADDRIYPYLPKLLGKKFIEKRGVPVQLKLEGKKFSKKQLQGLVSSHALRLKSMSTSYHVPIGNSDMPRPHLIANIMKLCKTLGKHVPGGWNNVRSIVIKGDRTMAIPCYMSLGADTESSVEPCSNDKEIENVQMEL